ncbi:MAG: DUF1003 domain-containing protein [Pseudomonadota bacterium]|jgi:uncharacterized membrane protein
MSAKNQQEVICQICRMKIPLAQTIPASLVRAPIAGIIRREHRDWSLEGYICLTDLNRFRSRYIEEVVEAEKGELSSLEKQVVKSIKEQEVLSSNLNVEFDRRQTFGERLSDWLAGFGGSWIFLMIFAGVLAAWIILNSIFLLDRPFDPYPYILLNLFLSCLAAVQAPIILMSQNRQEARDRIRAEHDYRVNLKAELEIRHLHEKLDHLLMQQWQRLLEIQKLQIEIMEEISEKTRS